MPVTHRQRMPHNTVVGNGNADSTKLHTLYTFYTLLTFHTFHTFLTFHTGR